jgi:Icc protein
MPLATGTEPPIRFLHITDTHLYSDPGRLFRGLDTTQTLIQVLAQAQTEDWPPAGVLLTGDLVHDEQAPGYDRLRRILDRLAVPVYPVAGNHDDPQLVATRLGSHWIRPQEVLDVGHWRLLFLDTHWPGEVRGRLTPEQLGRLETRLSEAATRPTSICMHHPPIPVGSPWLDPLGLAEPARLRGVIARHSQVKLVLCGHVHQDYGARRDGVLYLTTPSTCVQFLPRSAHSALDTQPPGYRWVSLAADGSVETRVRSLAPARSRP